MIIYLYIRKYLNIIKSIFQNIKLNKKIELNKNKINIQKFLIIFFFSNKAQFNSINFAIINKKKNY